MRADHRVRPHPAHHQPSSEGPAGSRDHRLAAAGHLGLLPARPGRAGARGRTALASCWLTRQAHRAAGTRGQPDRLAAGRPRRGRRFGVAAGSAAALWSVTFGVEGLAVGQDRVDLPGLPVRSALDPELVLPGVTAGGVPLLGCQPGRPGQAGLLGLDRAGVGDLDTEVVEAAALARVFQQDQLERRLGDGEVRIPGPDLGGSVPNSLE